MDNHSFSSLAFVLPSLAHGGAQKVILEIIEYLTTKNVDIVLIILDKEGELLDRIPNNLKVVSLDNNVNNYFFLKRAIQWLRLRKYIFNNNITHIFSTITGMNVFTLSCFLFSKEVHITIREATSLENHSNRILKHVCCLLYKRADKIICTSEYIKNQLLQLAHIKDEKIKFLPNPINLDKVRTLAKESPSISLHPLSATYKVIAAGRLIKAKGFDTLLEAHALASQSKDIHLVIVGDGPEKPFLENKITELHLTDSVSLIGYQSNPYPYIADADLFVLSSNWEGYVNVVIEAMVLGIDLVITDCQSGPGELLKNELGYKLIPINSPKQLSEAILYKLDNPSDTTAFERLLEPHKLSSAIKHYFGDQCAKLSNQKV